MRAIIETACALSLVACLPIDPATPAVTKPAALEAESGGQPARSFDEELAVKTEIPTHEYPDNFYDTPTMPAEIFEGRWGVDFEGSLFQDRSSGKIFVTTGVDDALMKFVSVGNTYYDWAGCLDVKIEAGVAKIPSPYLGGGPWLIVRRVISAELVEGMQDYGDDCLDFSR